jgi:hypothetical protein
MASAGSRSRGDGIGLAPPTEDAVTTTFKDRSGNGPGAWAQTSLKEAEAALS